jgi:formate C-acetyltransferase
LFNDEVITRGLRHYGLPPEEACLYIHSTCVEITPIASSAVWVASPYINLLQLLLDLLAIPQTKHPEPGQEPIPVKGTRTATLAGSTFADLLLAWRKHLGATIRQELRIQNLMQMERERHGGDPLVSCFVKDCLAKGLDLDQGGARYNWIMPSFVGLANLADAFVVLRRLVYEDKRLSLDEMASILADNFQHHERLRQEMISRIPKYGNDEDEADDLVRLITGWILEETEPLRTWRGGRVVPSLFCWIMHERLGSQTGASPDGRVSGFPLGDGSGPAQGREQKGPTASILSSTKWAHDRFIGGIAVNLKFGSNCFNDDTRSKMLDLVQIYMARGGFELQINAVDRNTLLQARQHPEAYQDLVVRVGGYSDYFVRLPPAMQEEVILRSEHNL